jgi:prepilin-type N-terminal cleavage/methylation domain-containing protein
MNKKSFTLIEILVVIVVIGVLSAFILVGMSSISQKASFAKGQAFINSMDNSLLLARVSQWKFDGPNNSGDATVNEVKDSWGVNDGIVTGHEPTIVSSGCPSGNCLSFDGSSDYVSCNTFQYLSTFTLSVWIKASSDVSDYRTILDKTSSLTNRNFWLNLYSGTGRLDLRFSVGGVNGTYSSGIVLNDNTWHYITATYDNYYVRFYVDGKISGTPTAQTGEPDNPSVPFYIGNQAGTRYFNGSIDDVRIYNQAIPTSEIQQNYFIGLNNLYKNRGLTQIEYTQRLTELKTNFTQD